jgi:putative transposase
MKRSYDGRDRRSIRLANYDYRLCGAYFVTLCTYARDALFGGVRDARMTMNMMGLVLPLVWARTVNGGMMPRTYDFVVMPNHVHGIVWLPGLANVDGDRDVVGARHPPMRDDGADLVSNSPSVGHLESVDASPLQHIDVTLRPRAPEPGSLGAVVSTFKSTSARAINRLRGTPGLPVWQRNYYERIVRADGELSLIRQYILDNPSRWADDPNNAT